MPLMRKARTSSAQELRKGDTMALPGEGARGEDYSSPCEGKGTRKDTPGLRSLRRGGGADRGALVLDRPCGARGQRRHPLRAGGRGRRAARLARGQAAA